MPNPNSITATVLLYGDYPELAQRCLGSITSNAFRLCPANLRVGMNLCSAETKQYVRSLVQQNLVLEENIYESDINIKKYPMMRRMLYDENNPVNTDYIMWFDDDSFVTSPQLLPEVATQLGPNAEGRTPDMMGSSYNIQLGGGQIAYIKDQSWYANKPITKKIRFATGGWWVIATEVLRKFNYPYPELLHRGGDVMLGALIEQQGLWLRQFRKHVAINADENGKESKAARRGFDEKPLGFNYTKGQKPAPPPQPAKTIVSKQSLAEIKAHAGRSTEPVKPKRPMIDLDL